MNKLITLFFILIASLIKVKAQILISGMNGNTIYSHIKNEIEYTGNCDCNGLTATI